MKTRILLRSPVPNKCSESQQNCVYNHQTENNTTSLVNTGSTDFINKKMTSNIKTVSRITVVRKYFLSIEVQVKTHSFFFLYLLTFFTRSINLHVLNQLFELATTRVLGCCSDYICASI